MTLHDPHVRPAMAGPLTAPTPPRVADSSSSSALTSLPQSPPRSPPRSALPGHSPSNSHPSSRPGSEPSSQPCSPPHERPSPHGLKREEPTVLPPVLPRSTPTPPYASYAGAGYIPHFAAAPHSQYAGIAKPTMMSVKPRSRSSIVQRPPAPRPKPRQQSFSHESASYRPLNTHSPVALAAAAAVNNEKIRRLLLSQGPLPIRHITSHLAQTIEGFGELSLSKQRRLIIAVLDGPCTEFVKVGWGRWAVEGSEQAPVSAKAKEPVKEPRRSGSTSGYGRLRLGAHRESISQRIPQAKLPLSPSLGPVEDAAVFSDTESSDNEYDDDSEVEHTDEEDWQAMGPAHLRRASTREQDAVAALVQLRSN